MTWFKNREEFNKWFLDRPERTYTIPVSPETYEAFNKAVMEEIERIKGHKVRFSKKNRI